MRSQAFTPLFRSTRTDRAIAALSDRAARLWFMLLAQLDAHGRIGADIDILNADVWPLQRRSEHETQVSLNECIAQGLVELHELDGRRWFQVPRWDDTYGAIGRNKDKPASEFPAPSCSSRVSTARHGAAPAGTDDHSDPPLGTDEHLARVRVRSAVVDAVVDADEERAREGGQAQDAKPSELSRKPAKAKTWQEVLARDEYAALRACAPAMEGWRCWIEHCETPRTAATVPAPTTAARILNGALKCLKIDGNAERFVEAVDDAITNNWQGVNTKWVRGFAARSGSGTPAPAATPSGSPEWGGQTREQREAQVREAWQTLIDDPDRKRQSLWRRAESVLFRYGVSFPELIPPAAPRPYPWEISGTDADAGQELAQ